MVDVYRPGTNSGHGHVWERPDGLKVRCGGPGLCKVCAGDLAKWGRLEKPEPAEIRPEALLAQLIRDHGRQGAARRLSRMLWENDKVRQAFAGWVVSRFGEVVSVPHEGKVT